MCVGAYVFNNACACVFSLQHRNLVGSHSLSGASLSLKMETGCNCRGSVSLGVWQPACVLVAGQRG